MVTCDFSGKEIPQGKGIMYVKSDGKVLHFFDSKCEKNYHMRKARNVTWTEEARKVKRERAAARQHEKQSE